MRNTAAIRQRLLGLGLSNEEALIFVNLLDGPKTQLEVSRLSGIARSSVYRIVDDLIEKSLVHELTTEDGKLLESAQPELLELLVVKQEVKAEKQRASLASLLPILSAMTGQEGAFAVKTYSGVAGLKQMLWNELKTKGEICMFSCGSLNPAVGKRFAEKFRAEIINRNIIQRAIENTGITNLTQSDHPEFISKHYLLRRIDPAVLAIMPEITIHDDTVSIYNSWTSDIQLGTEIKNPFLAASQRRQFMNNVQKVVLVTGSSRGIGKAICQTLLAQNYKVYGLSTSKSEFHDDNFVWLQCDLQDERQIEKSVSLISEARVDVLVNNAGVAFKVTSRELDPKSFDDMYGVNFLAPIRLMQVLGARLAD